jgi:hypothetical protein
MLATYMALYVHLPNNIQVIAHVLISVAAAACHPPPLPPSSCRTADGTSDGFLVLHLSLITHSSLLLLLPVISRRSADGTSDGFLVLQDTTAALANVGITSW